MNVTLFQILFSTLLIYDQWLLIPCSNSRKVRQFRLDNFYDYIILHLKNCSYALLIVLFE